MNGHSCITLFGNNNQILTSKVKQLLNSQDIDYYYVDVFGKDPERHALQRAKISKTPAVRFKNGEFLQIPSLSDAEHHFCPKTVQLGEIKLEDEQKENKKKECAIQSPKQNKDPKGKKQKKPFKINKQN